jgi:PBP1b-binding outer membrane lipoprotein LpoB
MKNYLSLLLVAIMITSCANELKYGDTENKNTDSQKSYSKSTLNQFEQIEKSDFKARDQSTKGPESTRSVSNNTFEITSPSGNVSDKLNELNQNLAYFCMKQRKNSRFKKEDDCKNFVKKMLDHCQKKYSKVNSSLIKCVKSGLHLK